MHSRAKLVNNIRGEKAIRRAKRCFRMEIQGDMEKLMRQRLQALTPSEVKLDEGRRLEAAGEISWRCMGCEARP